MAVDRGEVRADERSDELARRAADVIARTRIPIDAHCRLLLDALVADGVTRVDAARHDEALDRLRALLADMTQQGRILRLDVLPTSTLVGAVERLRPLWPWC